MERISSSILCKKSLFLLVMTLILFSISQVAYAVQPQITAGKNHNLIINTDGNLWAWGDNSWGQLGDGTTVNKHLPLPVSTDINWIEIVAGINHGLALQEDSTLWSWGMNWYGQLGDGTTVSKHIPLKIGSDTDWAEIAPGAVHSMALKTDGTLWAWGTNDKGQLGDGTTVNKFIPLKIGSHTDWSEIGAGNHHSLALKTDGTLWAWGSNNKGQLGDGTNIDKYSPVQIGTGTDWSEIGAGNDHSLALKTDGTLWAWGDNGYGQLGDGTTVDSSLPIVVILGCISEDIDGDLICNDGYNPCTGGNRYMCDDNCPNNANPGQEDTDNDGIGDECDNCPNDANSGQSDCDTDGIGDICETNTDNDSIPDDCDNCPNIANPNQEDVDSNGTGDVCDPNTIYGTISGDVREGVTVNIYIQSCGLPQPHAAVTTDAQGYYSIGEFANGRYLVGIGKSDFGFISSAHWVDIPQANIQSYDFTIKNTCYTLDRFFDNDDGTVTDCRTGRVWLKNPGCYGEQEDSPCRTLQDGECGLSDGSQAGDWWTAGLDSLIGLGTDPPKGYHDYSYSDWIPLGEPFENWEGLYITNHCLASNIIHPCILTLGIYMESGTIVELDYGEFYDSSFDFWCYR
jgi:alpha-tubulin suppressor-like RCC1 family protein